MIDEWKKGAKYWDRAWNPVIGCRKVSEGCQNCYAESMAERFPELRDADGGFIPHCPAGPKRPPKSGVVFVGNMTDIFGEWNSNKQIRNWLYGLHMNDDVTNLILTKRAARMADICGDDTDWDESHWFGITGENQERLEERLDYLLRCQAARRWLSLEPLLDEICLNSAICNVTGELEFFNPFRKWFQWVVVGAESGANRRPCQIEWVKVIVQQCREAEIPVFVKQLDINGKLEKDITKFPEYLQIRQVPWKTGENHE